MPSDSKPSILTLRFTPSPMTRRLVGAGAMGVVLFVWWFGIDETQKVMFIFIACVPFVYSSVVAAIASVPDRYVETAQTLGATPFQIVRKVLVALAIPEIYDSLRHLFGLAFGYIMLAELIDAQHGLGYL